MKNDKQQLIYILNTIKIFKMWINFYKLNLQCFNIKLLNAYEIDVLMTFLKINNQQEFVKQNALKELGKQINL